MYKSDHLYSFLMKAAQPSPFANSTVISRCFSGPFAQKVCFMDWLCNSKQGGVANGWIFHGTLWVFFLKYRYIFEVYALRRVENNPEASWKQWENYMITIFLGGKGPNLHHPLWRSVWAGPNVFMLIFVFTFCEFWKLVPSYTVWHFDVECYLLILLQLILWNLR